MDLSDKLDLALPLGWLTDHSPLVVLLIALVICPFGPYVLGPVLESRLVPLHPRNQFWAYFPGNPFLALFLALTVLANQGLPTDFQFPETLNHLALAFTALLYLVLNTMDMAAYKPRQMMSPTKVYHNFLYFWYAYVVFISGLAMYVYSPIQWWQKALMSIPLLLWLGCLAKDNTMSEEERAHKLAVAHIEDWRGIWATGRVRRYSAALGVYV